MSESIAARGQWIGWLVFSALWLVVCSHLALHWQLNPQYSFGWLVPPLSLYLARRRWNTRPAPNAGEVRWAKRLMVAIAATFFPAWLIAQPNPDWRLISWVLTAEIVGLTVAAVADIGGVRWMRHFAFPVCFILIAVPWPSIIEQPVIQGLMRLVAAVTVELLNLWRIPALQHGNVIEIGAGLLGVDEACSGVRSLQATLMASLFLGEMSRFDVARRVFLVGIGLAVALICNVGRAFLLAWNAAHQGLGAVDEWHDPAGFTILTICFVVVWLIALLLARGDSEPSPATDVPRSSGLPARFAAGLAVWFAFVFIATEIWFRAAAPPSIGWRIVPPVDSRELPIEPRAAEMLKSDRTTAATWANGRERWVMYFLEWRPGPSRSRILARMHRPEHCLPASGLRLAADRGTITVEAQGLAIPFRAYTFEQKKEPIFVYFCLWQSRSPTRQALAFDESTRLASLQSVAWRERNLGQQIAELAVFGYTDPAQADAALQRELPPLIERTAR